MQKVFVLILLIAFIFVVPLKAQPSQNSLQAKSKLLVVGTAHLDTQWRWTVKKSIEEYIPATFLNNYKLMDLHPDYVFSFEGAFRYMLMDEYYPENFEKVRGYINSGQWRVTGSWVDAVDVNIPSFESLVRHTLYGNGYFKKEFGKSSRDIFLPDCFGFGYALPSIANHCGLESFSTQKLTWGCWVGNPFDIGIWKGVDGSSIIGAVNPGAYVSEIEDDLSRDTAWINTAQRQGEQSGLFAAYRYFGTGDSGGAPDSASVAWLDKSIKSDGHLEVVSAGADDIIDLVKTTDRDKLPHYDGELIMTRHGTGCYTSQAAMKRWNRKNELLADATERASVIAYMYGGLIYPKEMLRDTWIRFLWHQFHDDLTGTSIPEAYEYSWNDEILCQNRFSAMLTNAVQTAAMTFDTRNIKGIPVIIYNPLSYPHQGHIEATIHIPGFDKKFIRAYTDSKQREFPCDIIEKYKDSVRIRFQAFGPQTGYQLYDIYPSDKPSELESLLSVSTSHLENEKYRVSINDNGEVSSIYDKQENKELLSSPLRYEILEDTPLRWPAWEVDYEDIMGLPLDLFIGKPEIKVVENGLASVAVRITQKTENSLFNTIVRLTSEGNIVEFETEIDWFERAKMLKLAMSTTTPNDSATYDIGLGVIKRGLNFEKRYEVPGQQWADLTAPDGNYGVAILNDCKYGWDHPTPEKMRLTLIHTPGIADGWDWVGDERSQDNGHHKIKFAIQGHKGDWRNGNVVWEAAQLNQPLTAFQTAQHEGMLQNKYSLISSNSDSSASSVWDPSIMINSIKLAENSDEIIIRVREINGVAHEGVNISFEHPVISAREVNGQEEEIGVAEINQGHLQFSLSPFQPKAFAITLESRSNLKLKKLVSHFIDLPFNLDGISMDDDKCDGDFDGHGYTLTGDLIPDTLNYLGIPFVFGPKDVGAMNVVKCNGQQIRLPKGKYYHLYLLAASVDGSTTATFTVEDKEYIIDIQDYVEPIGRWNSRLSDGELVEAPERIAPAYINRLPVAWYASHRHTPECENDIYRFTYLFMIDLTIYEKANKLTLPSNENLRIMAATLVNTPLDETVPVQPLYDETTNSLVSIITDSSSFAGSARLELSSPIPSTDIYYTLDGSEPTVSSALYKEPIIVSKTSTIKARAIREGYNNDYVASKTVNKIGLRDDVDIEDPGSGLTCKYYEAEWEKLPDFDTVEFVDMFITDKIAIPEQAREEDYGLAFKGYVKIPADGVYAFSINSDDGSRLIISDTLLVDNDGLHGDYEMTGMIGLKAGYHPLTALMFQCKGGEALGVSVAGPSLPKQAIPAVMLYHKEGELLVPEN
ncbi:MAG: glycoside hydrolase family 38 C-terminal domain-containing protein [bacterium]